jgi:hypothetical protein
MDTEPRDRLTGALADYRKAVVDSLAEMLE